MEVARNKKISLFVHLYYTTLDKILLDFLSSVPTHFLGYSFDIYINTTDGNHIIQYLLSLFPEAKIMISPNIGKDIGGKLALLELYLTADQKSDYLLFLHDKKSPHLADGNDWNRRLLKIINPEQLPIILNLLEKDISIGLIGSKECISNEFEEEKGAFKTPNDSLLKTYIQEFQFNIKDYSFLAGTMFWIRSKVFEKFFKEHPPLFLRSRLEKGNVMDDEIGTHTHCMERIFSWIVTHQGYKLRGI